MKASELDEVRWRLARGGRWQAGENKLSGVPLDRRRRRFGYSPPPGAPAPPERERAAREKHAAARAGFGPEVAYPPRHDWRDHQGGNYISAARDQGDCGACAAFAVVGVVEAMVRIRAGDPGLPVALSEAHLFYCHGRDAGHGCLSGWHPEGCLDAFRDVGVADAECYPYTAGDQDGSGLCPDWSSRATRITDWGTVPNPAEMKAWLATRGPLVTVFHVYEDFYYYTGGVYEHVYGDYSEGHVVCVVGYDEAEQYWICKNSAGPDWGEGGFFRFRMGQCGIDANMWGVMGIV